MCGIAGILDDQAAPDDELRRMIATLHHRGPDGSGVYVDGPCGLAHARLAIIDRSGGAQPMLTPPSSQTQAGAAPLALTFNGEIFNYVELREELKQAGRIFRTNSDTEVILHAYAVWGDACVERFNGQWAFALWDPQRRRLFCSRDRIGVRPFFWTRDARGRFVFASEVKALFATDAGCVARELDVAGLHEVITFWCALAPRTVWRGIHELPPGHNLVVEARGGAAVTRYWSLTFPEADAANDELTAMMVPAAARADAFFSTLLDAARLRLRADVPVGAYLSGGLDSAVVAGMIARHHRDTALETFSVTFPDDASYDESAYQREVAAHLGTRHRAVACTGDDIGALFPEVIRLAETPLLRTAPAPLLQLAGLVRDSGYKVVLTGEGADEMLGGYDIFKEAKIRRFWSRQPRSTLRPLLLKRLYPWMQSLQQQQPAYLRAFFAVDDADLASPFFSHLPRWRLTQQLRAFLHPDLRAYLSSADAPDPIEQLRARLPAQFSTWDPLSQAQYIEATTLLPGYILSSQGDRMAMGRSIEARFPFLDVRVMERAAQLPPSSKLRALDEKRILKLAAGSLVPASVRRRPKQPYRAPEAQSFVSRDREARSAAQLAYVDELLAPSSLQAARIFDVDAVTKLVDKVKRRAALGTRDNMAFLFVLSTQILREQFGVK